jgi:regulator of replication initiation timing
MPYDANDPDTKAAIDAIKADAATKLDSEVSGLKSKVQELIDDNKKLKKGREIDPAVVEKLEGQIDDLTGKLTDAQKHAKDATKLAETASKALETEQGFTHRLVAENGLMQALSASGVTDPAYLEAAKAMHIGAVKIVAEGENRNALYGDKPLADAIKEWAAGDVGKKFVAAPVNAGGGAEGGGGKVAGKVITRPQFNDLDQSARKVFANEGGKVVDQAA